MEVHSTRYFDREYKKLFPNQLRTLAEAIDQLTLNPLAGDTKKGALANVRVLKYKSLDQVWLLAYEYDGESTITLVAIGQHENFYSKLQKRQ